jgi:pyruvate dehydrogenase E2 component (dihydrolipoamide acetyltransferase)
MAELTMPSLGADMEDGTLVEWRIKPGDVVQRGDVVAEVETQKGIIEIEIWESGVVDELRVLPGAKVPVGVVLATIAAAKGAPPAADAAPAARAPEPAPPSADGAVVAPPAEAPAARAPAAAPFSRPAASPSARRLARELDVDLQRVHGSGPHGAITRDDVLRARDERSKGPSEAAVPAPSRAEAPSEASPRPPARGEAAAAIRQAIAAAMARSKREIPHYYLAHEIDVSRALAWLEAENQRRPVTERLLLAALLLKATALAAQSFQSMNGYYIDGVFRPATAVHVGVGIALRQGGLVAPAIHDVDRTSLGELMARLADLVQRARGGGLRSSELSDATLTVTNLGDQGTDSVFGIIYPPQVALVGFGKPKLKPWAEGGMLGIRPVVTATLAADHRVSDGHTGARFLNAIAQRLAEPEKL